MSSPNEKPARGQTPLFAGMALAVFLAGLGGYLLRSKQGSVETPSKPAPPAQPRRAEPPAPPPEVQPTHSTGADEPATAEPARTAPSRTLRQQGATVGLRLFSPSSLSGPILSARAKEYFQLTGEEEQGIQETFARRIRDLGEAAFQNALLRSNDGQTLVVTVPSDAGKPVMDQLRQDLAGILGRDRGEEFLEMGTAEFGVLLRGGVRDRLIEVTRRPAAPAPDGSEVPPTYQVREQVADDTTISATFDPQKEDDTAAWLRKFSGEMGGLTPSSPRGPVRPLQ